ncbi:BppU family phage baseplate upper protein [Enterococcus sp.]|uniref:BppU family phage baseplate upper protein n=1 Tax=unclassified Enterococcus TaxID=2608891 RepID=UPI000ED70CBA|nr:BppU family phage baseplate upper protein [Enterococcus sp.]HCM87947.1 DUF2479 domain-containing protein [Enterococcus sp.]
MSNIKLILTENKASPYRKQRVVGRLGDGELTVIDVELLQADGKTPYSIFSNHELLFVGTNSKGQYTDGVPEIIDGQNGKIRYTFTKENFSVIREFKRAYFQLTDADGNRVTFQDFYVDVLKNSDINQEHATVYVRLLELLLEDFEKQFGDKTIDFEERFKNFFQAKEIEYEYIYQMYNDLLLKLEKMTGETLSLQEKQMEIIKLVEEYDILTKAESSANVISQVIGKEKVELTFTTDFDSKTSGSVIENPNIARHNAIATLPSPENFGGSELSDLYYELVRKKDTRNFVTTQNVATRMSANLYSFSILECLKRELGDQFFSSLGAKTDKQCVEIIRKIVSYRLVSLWASGKSFEGNKVNMRMWSILTNSWLESSNSTSSEVKLITMSGLENTNNHYITDDGKIHILAYAEASDGNVASTINTDYVSLTFKINISVHDFIESTIAANHVENLATQDEAEAGEDNTKTMTPLRVFQAIAKWTKDKFVSMTENETVLGIKNFANGLQVNGRNVLSQKGEIVFDHTSETDSSIQSGIVRFKRYGDWILVNFNFQCRSTDIASGGNLIGVLEADIIPSGSIQVDITYDKALTIDASGKVTALWGLDANKYYIGSAMYFAKNKL